MARRPKFGDIYTYVGIDDKVMYIAPAVSIRGVREDALYWVMDNGDGEITVGDRAHRWGAPDHDPDWKLVEEA